MPQSYKVTSKNFKAHIEPLRKELGRCFDKEIAPFVKKSLYRRLYDNKNADGTPRPESSFVSQRALKKSKSSAVPAHAGPGEKSPDTVKAYNRAKQGWNTRNYLVRTGASTTLHHRIKRNGMELVIYPKGKDILKYHIPRSQWRGNIRWLELSKEDKTAIIKQLKRATRKALKK